MAAAHHPPAPPGFLDDEKLEEILADVGAAGNAEESHASSSGGLSPGSSARYRGHEAV